MPGPNHPTLILASASPRRREMLRQLGLEFDLRPVGVDESPLDGEDPVPLVRRLARAKALAAAEEEDDPEEVILAADTIVVLDGEILGKPESTDEAEAMLARLAGREHTVHTGVAVLAPGGSEPEVEVESTRVELARLEAETIARYVATGEPMDKAGAYAIQGLGATFVSRIHGSYSNVVGLPLTLTRALLAPQGIDVPRLPAIDDE